MPPNRKVPIAPLAGLLALVNRTAPSQRATSLKQECKSGVNAGTCKRVSAINFNRFFYKYVSQRKLVDIDADLKQVEPEIAQLLGEVTD